MADSEAALRAIIIPRLTTARRLYTLELAASSERREKTLATGNKANCGNWAAIGRGGHAETQRWQRRKEQIGLDFASLRETVCLR